MVCHKQFLEAASRNGAEVEGPKLGRDCHGKDAHPPSLATPKLLARRAARTAGRTSIVRLASAVGTVV